MTPKPSQEIEAVENPIQLGMKFTVARGAFWWVWEGKRIEIPVGTSGQVVKWHPGCAVAFEGFTHPHYQNKFLLELVVPGKSPVPDWMQLVEVEAP